jgi:hypothetical protein
MRFLQNIRKIILPLDPTMDRNYREQLVTVATPLQTAAILASVILWIIVLRIHRTLPEKPIYSAHAVTVQAWLLFMMVAPKKIGHMRTLAIITTPFFQALIAYFF